MIQLIICMLIGLCSSNPCHQLITLPSNTLPLNALASSIATNRPNCLIVLSPKYYWGQNMTHIMIKFELVTSADTYGCDRLLWSNTTARYQGFNIQILCQQSTFVLGYFLDVITYKGLNYHHSIWKYQNANTLIFQSLKTPVPYFWNLLHSRNTIPHPKPKVWWTIYHKYRSTLESIMGHLEIHEEDYDRPSHHRKQILSPQSNIYYYCYQEDPYHLGSWL